MVTVCGTWSNWTREQEPTSLPGKTSTLYPRDKDRKLKHSSIKLTAFGGRNIPVTWKCTIKCQVNNTTQTVKFQIIEKGKYLLGCKDCKKLKLVTFNVNIQGSI